MGFIPATNTRWGESLLLAECMFESYLLRLRRHSSLDRLLNNFGLIRIGPGAILVPTPSSRTWLNSIWGPRPIVCFGDFTPTIVIFYSFYYFSFLSLHPYVSFFFFFSPLHTYPHPHSSHLVFIFLELFILTMCPLCFYFSFFIFSSLILILSPYHTHITDEEQSKNLKLWC